MNACLEEKHVEDLYELDGEEIAHASFTENKMVMTLPDFADPSTYEDGTYESAVQKQKTCQVNLKLHKKTYNSPPEAKDPPRSSIYPSDYVTPGVMNTLICHVTGFFPPELRVKWTKNNEDVTEGVTISQFRFNEDGTFNAFSTLSFTPEKGDIYTCTVEHRALQEPLKKEWDADDEITVPSIGPSVFCGVGLTVGLLGVAVGTFFLVKGNNCN
ncbi:H-2 class II histocompatibility antigen, A-K alpha chain-like [Chanos chanos]|uniref:H-2 class II histocompatibility antigen, A-K alpha chain-like n=1 Tax=Chanos chanos TaxID=29144 RepID=A0A6J2UMY6_CHACN|nr:H-2 class II histocompatibility antigen, A-K alpha chain-like [Chanos chanos]